jgi:hypothetical protein
MSERTYHAFLSHNSADKPAVEALARRLRAAGVEPWLDRWNLVTGEPWQSALAGALDACETCVVFVGPGGIGPWQNEEMRAAIDRRVRGGAGAFRVIPVLLPGASRDERSRLPSFLVAATWVEFRDALDNEDALHRLVCGIRGVQPGPGPGEALPAGECPYRGLRAFDVAHAPFFFGREALTGWLLNELRPAPAGRDGNRFLAVVGASGSGKSSLVRAGLLASLARGEIGGSGRWPQSLCRPGPDPLESLAVALAANPALFPGTASCVGLASDLEKDPRALHLVTRVALHGAPDDARAVVVVDQFEELFTTCADDGRRRHFIDSLLYAATVVGGRTVVVVAMRADFYGKCAAYPDLAAAVSDHNVLVGPPEEADLRRAIERPAWLAGCELEPGLCAALLRDAQNQAGALPLLQHTLAELWVRRAGRRLTFGAYEALGRLPGALERRANEVLDQFDAREHEICRRIFLRLTQPGEGTEDTKRRVAVGELLPAEGDPVAVERVLHALADARLVTVEGGLETASDTYVEVAHEALIRGWSRLLRWIDADREALRIHRRLSGDAAEWDARGREDSYLYRGGRLAVVEEWSAGNAGALNSLERAFLEASRAEEARAKERERFEERLRAAELERATAAAREEEEGKRRRVIRGLSFGMLAALVAMIIGGKEAYDSLQQLLDDGEQARKAHGVHLARLRARVDQRDPAPTIEAMRDLIAAASSAEEVDSGNEKAAADEHASQATKIILAATVLAVLVAAFSLALVNRRASISTRTERARQ